MCSTDFNLNLEDFPTLPNIVPVRNSVSLVNPLLKLLVLVPFVQVNPFVITMLLQVNLLVLALFIQVNPLVIEMSVQLKLSALVLVVQLNQFVIVMLV